MSNHSALVLNPLTHAIEVAPGIAAGDLCEGDSCEAPATERVAGETDSFGTEWIYMCASCAQRLRDLVAEMPFPVCERCGHKYGKNLSQCPCAYDRCNKCFIEEMKADCAAGLHYWASDNRCHGCGVEEYPFDEYSDF